MSALARTSDVFLSAPAGTSDVFLSVLAGTSDVFLSALAGATGAFLSVLVGASDVFLSVLAGTTGAFLSALAGTRAAFLSILAGTKGVFFSVLAGVTGFCVSVLAGFSGAFFSVLADDWFADADPGGATEGVVLATAAAPALVGFVLLAAGFCAGVPTGCGLGGGACSPTAGVSCETAGAFAGGASGDVPGIAARTPCCGACNGATGLVGTVCGTCCGAWSGAAGLAGALSGALGFAGRGDGAEPTGPGERNGGLAGPMPLPRGPSVPGNAARGGGAPAGGAKAGREGGVPMAGSLRALLLPPVPGSPTLLVVDPGAPAEVAPPAMLALSAGRGVFVCVAGTDASAVFAKRSARDFIFSCIDKS